MGNKHIYTHTGIPQL